MSSPYQYTQQPTTPSTLTTLSGRLSTYWTNFRTQTHTAFTNATPKDYIRLLIIICAYALIIRPLLLKLGAKHQEMQHERDAESRRADGKGHLGPNDLREKIAIPGVDSGSESEEEVGKGDVVHGEWGRKARVRQRRVVRRALEVKEQIGIDEDDADIKEFLED